MKDPITLFLIDDDIDDQEIFVLALEELDQKPHCVIASDGAKALEKLNRDKSFIPDYIFVDMNMPRMNGLECVEEIRKLNHLDDSKIIMFSTSSDKKIIEKSKELGADLFLVKPSGLTALSESISNIITN